MYNAATHILNYTAPRTRTKISMECTKFKKEDITIDLYHKCIGRQRDVLKENNYEYHPFHDTVLSVEGSHISQSVFPDYDDRRDNCTYTVNNT